MSGNCELPTETLCGCCEGLTQETPQAITNRPALSEISYRTGTYSTFFGSMLAALSDSSLPPLQALRTRDSSDFTIALLDAWAGSLDVLTFYQERLANEAFLRTAVDSRSVFELARLIGYVPSPGVAASAVLAYTLNSAPGSPDNITIPAGTRVQSVPAPGQKPQIFETSSDLTAVIAYNALPARTHIPWTLNPGDTSTWIVGSANNLHVGDALLFIATSASGQPSQTGPADLRYVSRVQIDASSGNTQVWWNAVLINNASATANVAIYIFRKKAALFGAQAINPYLLPSDTLAQMLYHPALPTSSTKTDAVEENAFQAKSVASELQLDLANLYILQFDNDWQFHYDTGSHSINLDAAYSGLAPAGTDPDQLQWLALVNNNEAAVFAIQSATESNPNLYALTAKTSQLTLASVAAPLAGSPGSSTDATLAAFVENETRITTAFVSSDLLTPASLPITQWSGRQTYRLAPGIIVPVQGTSLAVVGGQNIAPQQPIGVSGKRVRLQIGSADGVPFIPASSAGELPVADSQVFLVNAFPPVNGTAWSVSTLSGIAGTLTVAAGNLELLPADKSDVIVSEAALVNTVTVTGDITKLTLASALNGIYDATTVTVNANAVEATNGETVQEILGNGAANNSALQFTLKQAPLTYVTAATENGTQSTLEVWVNNLQWHEVPNLLSAGPADRVFTTRVSPNGSRIVQFGNGTQGARTPTGQMNIRAMYRKGIGSAGMVNANQLSQALDRPQGVKSVTNPSPASGAADPATADASRGSAPLPTLTVGRIVSLLDYQNFALNFSGIAKALATWTWIGQRRSVLLTVAGANGAVLKDDDPVVQKLIAAIQQSSNPFIPLQVVPYVPVQFQVGASVKVDTTDYDSGLVMAQVWMNLQTASAFGQRRLAQNVVGSEIVEIIQNTPGVVAVRLTALNHSGTPPGNTLPTLLCASGPLPPQGAQMLLLDPASQGLIGAWS